MAPVRALSEYERRRAENIAKNKEELARLGIVDVVRDAAGLMLKQRNSAARQKRVRKRSEPVVLRRSLRTRGLSPESFEEELQAERPASKDSVVDWRGTVPLAKLGDEENEHFYKSVLDHATTRNIQARCIADDDADIAGFQLRGSSDVIRLVPDRILSLEFLPIQEKPVLVAGDKTGHIGVWNASNNDHTGDADKEEVTRLYRPHESPVSGVACTRDNPSKILTCSYDGCLVEMDFEGAAFTKLHTCSDELTAMCYGPDHAGVYIGQGQGELIAMDSRSGRVSSLAKVHERRVNTVSFSATRPHLFATSSSDSTLSIWDVRKLCSSSIATMSHKRAVSSAYFSPATDRVVSTSYDNRIGIWEAEGGRDDVWKRASWIDHYNQTSRWISTFRAIWSRSDRYVMVASMSRSIDVLSAEAGSAIACLRSDEMTSIPCRLALHHHRGWLAGGAAGGKVYLWRPSVVYSSSTASVQPVAQGYLWRPSVVAPAGGL